MRVKYKTLIVSIVSILLIIFCTSAIVYFICNNYIDEQEAVKVKDEFETVNSIIRQKESDMESRTIDYANWDETYEFINNKNRGYIISNFSGNTLDVLDINMMLYLDGSSNNVLEKNYNLNDDEIKALNKDIFDVSNTFNKLSNFKNAKDIHSGFLVSSGKIFMISCCPISKDSEEVNSNGILIVGKVIDESFINYITSIAHLKLEFLNKDNIQSFNSEKLKMQNGSIEISKTQDSIKASKMLKDINGKEAIICSITLDRDEYNNGIYYFKIFSLVFFTLIVLVIIAYYYIINRYIIDRINILRKFMEEVSNTKNTNLSIKVDGNDEISELAVTTNKMLSKLDSASKKISFLSYYDKLTGLKNRDFVEKKLKELDKEENIRYSIILGDLNGLKLTNDALGHIQGDKLLCIVGSMLKEVCSNDDIIARWGGDEFIILMINKDDNYVNEIISRIKGACYKITELPFRLSIALGSAGKEDDSQSAEAVMNLAEERMHRNKLLEKNSSRGSTIISLERTLYEKHSETEEHTVRIKNLSTLLGKKLGLSQEKLDELELLGMLHDIGKIGIPDNVLMKPGRLTNEEWEIMKSHTEIGYRIATSTPELAHISNEILYHHERFDGTGYPEGLKGEQIPLLSRIINIVDSFDVMTHSRCYKQAMSLEDAIEELTRCSGTQFDPFIVTVFIELLTIG